MKARHKLLAAAAAALVAVVLLAACSVEAPQNLSNQQNEGAPAASAAAATADATAGSVAGQTGGGTVSAIDPGDSSASGKKVVYTVSMTIEAKDVVATIDSISTAAAGDGGYVSSMSDSEQGRDASSSIEVRIPPEKLKDFTQHVGTLGRLLAREMSTQDVTDKYYDVQARLTNAQAQEAQLLDIMKQAVKIDDILKVRQELNTEEQEIEQLKGQIRLMDNQVGYSTVTITIQQPALPAVVANDEQDKATGVQFWGFQAVGQKIAKGFSDSFNWTLNAISWMLMVLSYMIVPLLIIAVIVLVIVLVVRAATKKKKA